MSQPHPKQDLISLYGLGPLAKSVARFDPVTGAKVKGLRKSYKNQIKDFQLPGNPEPVKHLEGQPGGMWNLIRFPDEEWHAQATFGKEVGRGLSETKSLNLRKSTRMIPGKIESFD